MYIVAIAGITIYLLQLDNIQVNRKTKSVKCVPMMLLSKVAFKKSTVLCKRVVKVSAIFVIVQARSM